MSHTPGPWNIVDHPTETCQIIAENSIRVCDVWCTDLPGGMENARLIAAAPALLEACKAICAKDEKVDDWLYGCQCIEPNTCGVCLALRAIAQAEGR